jgi:general secretion pathway protein A
MFLEFYGLKQEPFGVTPDPRFLYLSKVHREAMASLYYGLESGRGFLALIAVPGMGKTTMLFHLLERFSPTARTAFVFQTQCSSREFMRFLLLELGCGTNGGQDLVAMHEKFNHILLQGARAGRRLIIVVDEAQNLDPTVLETIRLLSNFETPRAKLLQIVLSGQPELADKLADPSLRQLRQRISVISSLDTLSEDEVKCYVEHRLKAAGLTGPDPFTAEAYGVIADLSHGIPRNINNLCFNALTFGFNQGQKMVNADIVREVAAGFDMAKLLSQPDKQICASTLAPVPPSAIASAPSFKAAAGGLPTQDAEALTPSEAKAYLKQITALLNNGSQMSN